MMRLESSIIVNRAARTNTATTLIEDGFPLAVLLQPPQAPGTVRRLLCQIISAAAGATGYLGLGVLDTTPGAAAGLGTLPARAAAGLRVLGGGTVSFGSSGVRTVSGLSIPVSPGMGLWGIIISMGGTPTARGCAADWGAGSWMEHSHGGLAAAPAIGSLLAFQTIGFTTLFQPAIQAELIP